MEYSAKRLTTKDWKEVVGLREVREGWGLESDSDETAFKNSAYAAKFSYMSDGPGYAGDLIVLLGGVPECPPTVIIRRQGELEVVDTSKY